MHTTAVRADGCLPLGDDARRLGFVPGAVVQVIVTSAGSLILAIDDSPVLDLPAVKPLPGAADKALAERWRATG